MATHELARELAEVERQLAENARQLQSQPLTGQPVAATSWWRADQAMTISAVVLVFGVFVLLLAAVLLRRTQVSADSVLRVFGTVLIIICAIFLVVAGYTDQQMGPVMGLLGTIAGYLLGKSSNSTSATSEPGDKA